MPYVHTWGPPHTAVQRDGTNIPRQVCAKCDTSRNPITREIQRYGRGSWCWDASGAVPLPETDYRAELHRVRQQLEFAAQAGEKVDLYYAKPQRARSHE